jgi:lipoprotein-anchoring transpeptidase ErfK/SrfK
MYPVKTYQNRTAASQPEIQPAKNWFLIINLVVAVLLGILTILLEVAADPPFAEFKQACAAISEARKVRASVYEPELLMLAESYLEQSRLAWRSENQRTFINRHFATAHSYAKKAQDKASLAEKRSIAKRDSLKTFLDSGLRDVKQRIVQLKPHFQDMPVENAIRRKFSLGELLVLESEVACKRNDYKRAAAKYQTAVSNINAADQQVSSEMQSYMSNAPRWRRWIQDTIKRSTDSCCVAILVDKLAHSCVIVRDGKKVAGYDIELGPNWLGYKMQRGDGATPEGRYYIRKKKNNGQSAYYKALEINYPNEDDLARFYSAKKNGDLALSAKTGGLIEIHGDGGRGANWTAGCVALKNADMDKVFEATQVGTPVTIVGSLNGISIQ